MSLRLRSKVSPAALQTIREAFEDLERIVTPAEAKEFGDSTLQNVQKAALEIENELGARQSLRNMRRIMPLFTGLDHYSKSIEVLCNGTPFLPWVWAPVKLILTFAKDYVDAFQEIIKHYARIGEALPRIELLQRALGTNQEFQNVLAVFYSDILRYHHEAYKFVRRRSWTLFFTTSFGRFERRFEDMMASMRAHEDLLDKTANAINIVEASQMRAALKLQRQEQLAAMEKEESDKALQQYREVVAWLKVDLSEQSLILDCITEESQRFPGGCDWILKIDAMKSWLQSTASAPFVWLQGKPGSGKSVLAAQILGFLHAANQSLVVSHFCTYSYASSTRYECILRSLLLQLIQGNTDLIAYLYKLKDTEFAKRAVTPQALERLIGMLAPTLSKDPGKTKYVHLVVDGLDECEEGKRDRLLALLERLGANSGSPTPVICKLLLLSRHSDALARRLRKKPTVSLTEQNRHVDKAIQSYASRSLETLRQRLDQMEVSDEDLDHMAKTLAEKADGMFLWARLVLQYIAKNMFYTKEEIIGALQSLPRELSEFYRRILAQITEGFNALSTQRLKSVFGWIAYAKRPLKEFEFQSALAFGSGDIDVGKVAPSHIFTMCSPLIEKRKDSTYAFIHVSLKSYLQDDENGALISAIDASFEHSIALSTCLLSGLKVFGSGFQEHNRNLRVVHGLHAFHIYAAEYWLDHLMMAGTSPGCFDRSPLLCLLLSQLSSKLEDQGKGQEEPAQACPIFETPIQCLRNRRGLFEAAKAILEHRSTKYLANQGTSAQSRTETTGLSRVLASYQKTVQTLLLLRVFPGVPLDVLERFKRSHKTSAFTCRLGACARATVGFENEASRLEHERGHVQHLYCEEPGCPYPPFPNPRALKTHVNTHHRDVPITPRPIRSNHTPISQTRVGPSVPKGPSAASISLQARAQVAAAIAAVQRAQVDAALGTETPQAPSKAAEVMGERMVKPGEEQRAIQISSKLTQERQAQYFQLQRLMQLQEQQARPMKRSKTIFKPSAQPVQQQERQNRGLQQPPYQDLSKFLKDTGSWEELRSPLMQNQQQLQTLITTGGSSSLPAQPTHLQQRQTSEPSGDGYFAYARNMRNPSLQEAEANLGAKMANGPPRLPAQPSEPQQGQNLEPGQSQIQEQLGVSFQGYGRNTQAYLPENTIQADQQQYSTKAMVEEGLRIGSPPSHQQLGQASKLDQPQLQGDSGYMLREFEGLQQLGPFQFQDEMRTQPSQQQQGWTPENELIHPRPNQLGPPQRQRQLGAIDHVAGQAALGTVPKLDRTGFDTYLAELYRITSATSGQAPISPSKATSRAVPVWPSPVANGEFSSW